MLTPSPPRKLSLFYLSCIQSTLVSSLSYLTKLLLTN